MPLSLYSAQGLVEPATQNLGQDEAGAVAVAVTTSLAADQSHPARLGTRIVVAADSHPLKHARPASPPRHNMALNVQGYLKSTTLCCMPS